MGVKNWQTSLSYLTQKGDAVVARLEHLAHNLFEHLVGMMTRGHGRVSQSLPSSLRVALLPLVTSLPTPGQYQLRADG